MPKPPPPESPFWKLFGGFTRLNTVLFRATGGRIGGRFGRLRILLLHHTGRRSGQRRVTPLLYVEDAPNIVIVASKGGTDKHPAWFHNLMAMEETEVELPGGETRAVRPRVAEGEERERLWGRSAAAYPPYESYARHTERHIPVVVLEPAA